MQLSGSHQLERDKLESSLVLKAIDSNDPVARIKALKFLVNIDLIKDPQGKIAKLQEEEIPRIQEQPTLGASDNSQYQSPIAYSQKIVDTILKTPGVPYPQGVDLSPGVVGQIAGVVLHNAFGPDSSIKILRDGTSDLHGPLAHWNVSSDGSIEFVAKENATVSHLGIAGCGLRNSNTIGIETTGLPAFADDKQIENLVRLIADIADRWSIPTNMIISHAEVALPPGRRSDMLQQGPALRKMVDAVRKRHPAQQGDSADSLAPASLQHGCG